VTQRVTQRSTNLRLRSKTVSLPRINVPRSFDVVDKRFDELWEPLRKYKLLDTVFYTASEVGDFGMVWLAIGAVQAAVGPASKTHDALRLAGALGLESLLVNGGIKSLFRRERPAWDQSRPLHLRKPRTSSFPSGHTSSAVTAAILLTDSFPKAVAPAIWGAAGIVALSRVHVKIHHITDVAGGVVVGAIFGTLVRNLVQVR
jgi:undecaprenyl-diphosphatase